MSFGEMNRLNFKEKEERARKKLGARSRRKIRKEKEEKKVYKPKSGRSIKRTKNYAKQTMRAFS